MKRLFLSLAILVSVSLTATVAAQGAKKDAKRGAHFSKELNLSDEQKQKVEAADAQFKSQVDELKAKSDLSKEDKRAKTKELRDKHRATVKNVLTPDQQAKAKELRDKRGSRDIQKREHKGDRKSGIHANRGERGSRKLDEASRNKIAALSENFEKEKKAVQMSRIAPDAQKQKIADLRKNFKKEKRQIIEDSSTTKKQ